MNNYRDPCAQICLLLGLLLILIMPLVITSTVVFPYITPKATITQLSVILCLLAFVIGNKSRLRITWGHVLVLTYLGVVTLSAIIGVDPVRSLLGSYERQQGVITIVYWNMFAFCLAHLIREERTWRLVFQWASVACYFICFLALAHYYGFVTIESLSQDGYRLSYTMGNASILGAYLACTLPLVSVLLASAIRRKSYSIETFLHAAGLLLLIITLLATGTRSAIAASALWGCFVIFTLVRKARLVFIGLLISIILIATIFNWHLIEARLADFTLESIAVSGRLDAWRIALRAIFESPVIGIGAENFITVFGAFSLPGEAGFETFDNPHSHLFDIAVSSGILGLACYVTLIYSCAKILFRGERTISNGITKENTWIIAGVMLMYQMTASVLFEAHPSQLLFYLALAYCLSVSPDLESSINIDWKVRTIGGGLICIALLHTTISWLDVGAMKPFTTNRWYKNLSTAGNIYRSKEAVEIIAPKIWSDWRSLDSEQKTATVILLKNLVKRDPNFNWRALSKLAYAWLRIGVDFPKESVRLRLTADKLLQLAPGRWETYEFLAYFYLAQGEKNTAAEMLRAYLGKDSEAVQLRKILRRLESS